MKKLTKGETKRMIAGLRYALGQVRMGLNHGLCRGLDEAMYHKGVINFDELEYLKYWISRMLKREMYLEGARVYSLTARQRYLNRKPWVEWIIQHLKETT